jgi:hypothetical protein
MTYYLSHCTPQVKARFQKFLCGFPHPEPPNL